MRPQDLAALGGSPELAAELVSAGLWEKRRGGGWKFHQWERKNPTKEAVEKDRRDAADRQRRRRDRLLSHRDSLSDNGVSHTTPSRRDGSTKDTPVPSRGNARASPPGSPAAAGERLWCGECDPRTRMLEDAEGRPYRCRICHPAALTS